MILSNHDPLPENLVQRKFEASSHREPSKPARPSPALETLPGTDGAAALQGNPFDAQV